jgi:hypothetical protein
MALSEYFEELPKSKLTVSFENFDALRAVARDRVDDPLQADVSLEALADDVDTFVCSLESIIDSGQCTMGTATMVWASLESISARMGVVLTVPSLEDAGTDPEVIHNIAMEAFGDILGRIIQGYVNKYKTMFAALIILFQGRAKLAQRHKRRIGEYRQEWKEKEKDLYKIRQTGSSNGMMTQQMFYRNNKVETDPMAAMASDMAFYRWMFGPYSRTLEQMAKTVGSTFKSVKIQGEKDIDTLVGKLVKLKRPIDVFDQKYLNKGPILMGNVGFTLRTSKAPKPAGRTPEYERLAEMSGKAMVYPVIKVLKKAFDPSFIWKDVVIKNDDVLKYLDLLEESCDIIIDYVERMKIHTAPYWAMVDDMKHVAGAADGVGNNAKRAIKQCIGYGDSIRYQHFFLVKQMSMVLNDMSTAGTYFISRLIARSK